MTSLLSETMSMVASSAAASDAAADVDTTAAKAEELSDENSKTVEVDTKSVAIVGIVVDVV